MQPEYIVVQAGGKGTRLKHLTRNKPKALVPVDNLPMLFHLFRKYPKSKYVIIGDYHYEVLCRYLAAFAEVDCTLVRARGPGTCAGVREALSELPEDVPFLLIWSDLILPEELELPDEPADYVGIAKDFPCRWKYEDGRFAEERSAEFGVAGLFLFQSAAALRDVPEEGELVRWLAGTGRQFESIPLRGVREYGLLEEYEKLEPVRCRPFNRIYREGDLFVKEPIDRQGEALARREAAWYRKLERQSFDGIPRIFSYSPLKMEYVHGNPVYEREGMSREERLAVLRQIVGCLRAVQALESIPADAASYEEAYIGKTFQRLEKVRDLVPFAGDEYVQVNGRRCRNIFGCRELLRQRLERYMPARFRLIHGDCTFSNVLLRDDGTPVLIDPRGYFGFTELCGDPAYDWAKLYYSLVGNYDQFNRKRFTLDISREGVELQIASNGWEDLESAFFDLVGVQPEQIRLIHAVIWLSLTTYAWEDYDSICGAFYNGLYYLEEALG